MERNIPQWAFKAATWTAGIIVAVLVAGLTIIVGIAQDVAVVKDRSESFKTVEKMVYEHDAWIKANGGNYKNKKLR